MRENPNPHLAKLDQEKPTLFHSGFIVGGRPEALILPPYPHIAAPYDRADLTAWKAMNIGKAADHMQLRVIEHLAIITNFNGDPYVAGDALATAYAAGKRSVFKQINDMVRFVEAPRQNGPMPKEQG